MRDFVGCLYGRIATNCSCLIVVRPHSPMKLFPALLLCFLTACSERHPAESTYEATGTQAQRVAEVSRLLSKRSPLPTQLLDAYFIEERIGDGRLGPSDFYAFYSLKIAPADLNAWRAVLPPIDLQSTTITYSSPKKRRTWWLTQNEFRDLTFYNPVTLTGRNDGWVAVTPDGRVFVYAFTM